MAAAVPGPVLAGLGRRVDELLGPLPGARWTEGTTRHITLKFLGFTPAERLPEVKGCCRAVASREEPGELCIEGFGAFPKPPRATVLWAGVTDPTGMLGRLAGGLDDAFVSMGYPAEQRPFAGHVTLARFRPPTRLELPDLEPLGPYVLSHIGLHQSHLSRGGARYTRLAAWPLGRG